MHILTTDPLTDKRLLGEWSGEISQAVSDFSYSATIHLEAAIANSFICYSWPDKQSLKIKINTVTVIGDSIFIKCDPATGIIFGGVIAPAMNGFTITGTWTNAKGTIDTARKYDDLKAVRNGIFAAHRDKTANELAVDFINSGIAEVLPADLPHFKDSLATVFYTNYLLLKDPALVYDTSATAFVITIDGCYPFSVRVPINKIECFKKIYNNRELNHTIQYHWEDPPGKTSVTYFFFASKIGYPCPTSSFTYGTPR